MSWSVVMRCAGCDEEWHSKICDTKPQAKVQSQNLRIVADNHYGRTGHHVFNLETVESVVMDVARLADPSQLRLSDDPDHAHLDPQNWNMKP